jgi:hypothetical protein
MALIVKSGIGQLRTIPMSDETASRVAQALISEGRSFYVEPVIGGRSTIFVDVEHEARVRELAGTELDHIPDIDHAPTRAKAEAWIADQTFSPEDLDVDWTSTDTQPGDGFVYVTAMVSISIPFSALR